MTESSAFHVMAKGVPPLFDNMDAVLDPPDADPTYSAKVMLLAMPDAAELYHKVLGLSSNGVIDDKTDTLATSRMINFLVGECVPPSTQSFVSRHAREE
jgi:hypothetical protein